MYLWTQVARDNMPRSIKTEKTSFFTLKFKHASLQRLETVREGYVWQVATVVGSGDSTKEQERRHCIDQRGAVMGGSRLARAPPSAIAPLKVNFCHAAGAARSHFFTLARKTLERPRIPCLSRVYPESSRTLESKICVLVLVLVRARKNRQMQRL